MKTKNTVQFISGTFTAQDAKELLTALLNYKINYHSLKNFSHIERFGNPVAGSQQRIAELQKAKENIDTFVNQAIETERSLILEASIHIFLGK